MPDKAPRRILIFTETFLPREGGSERVAHNMAKTLSERGFDVTVYAPSMNGDKGFDKKQVYRVYRSSVWSRLKKIDETSTGVKSRLARFSAALVHTFELPLIAKWDTLIATNFIPVSLPSFVFSRFPQKQVISWVHGEEIVQGIQSGFMKTQIKMALRNSDWVFTNSRYTANQVRKLNVSENKIKLQFPTPDASFFVEDSPSSDRDKTQWVSYFDDFEPNAKLLVTVSRLVERKGIDKTLEALARLTDYPWVYIIGGVGPDKRRLQLLRDKLGLEKRVKFIGRIEESEKRDLLTVADVFVMPNRKIESGEFEGFGIVFVEAALCGTPSIGGTSGGTKDAIEEGVSGWRVDGSNSDHVEKCLRNFFSAPEEGKLVPSEVKKWAVEKFRSHYDHDPLLKRLGKK